MSLHIQNFSRAPSCCPPPQPPPALSCLGHAVPSWLAHGVFSMWPAEGASKTQICSYLHRAFQCLGGFKPLLPSCKLRAQGPVNTEQPSPSTSGPLHLPFARCAQTGPPPSLFSLHSSPCLHETSPHLLIANPNWNIKSGKAEKTYLPYAGVQSAWAHSRCSACAHFPAVGAQESTERMVSCKALLRGPLFS